MEIKKNRCQEETLRIWSKSKEMLEVAAAKVREKLQAMTRQGGVFKVFLDVINVALCIFLRGSREVLICFQLSGDVALDDVSLNTTLC